MPLAAAVVLREIVGVGVGPGVGVGVGVGPGAGVGVAPLAADEPPPAHALSTMPAAIIRLSRRDIPVIDPLPGGSASGFLPHSCLSPFDTDTMMTLDLPCQYGSGGPDKG